MPCRCAECKQKELNDFLVKTGFWYEEVARRHTACVRCFLPGCPRAQSCTWAPCPNERPQTVRAMEYIKPVHPMTNPKDLTMDYPQISPKESAQASRCPLCGILLDISVDIESRADTKQALVTLMPKARDHVTSPHTMDFPADLTA